MIPHSHVLQGITDGCLACESIRPESQVHPYDVPPLPVANVPTTFEPDEDKPTTPAFVEALTTATHRIVDERPVCDGGRESKCHWWPHPRECDHESFPCGHEYVFHDECWIIQWLDVGLEDTADDESIEARIVVGDDLRWPNGVIDWEWQGDYVSWHYASIDADPEPATPPDGRRDSDVPLWA